MEKSEDKYMYQISTVRKLHRNILLQIILLPPFDSAWSLMLI
jgi:hypothetical protein